MPYRRLPKLEESTETLNNADTINKLLSDYHRITDDNSGRKISNIWKRDSTIAIFVHSSVFCKFQKIFQYLSQKSIVDSYDYELRVGSTIYHMKLVYVKNINDNVHSFIVSSLVLQQYSLVFEETVNIFISAERYPALEEFIRKHQLEKDIVHIETKPGFIYDASGNTDFTIVTFSQTSFHVLKEIITFHYKNYEQIPPAYYLTIALPWLQPSRIKHLRKPIAQETYRVVHQFLICLRELSYDREPHTNLLDLCNLKLAFHDERGMNDWDVDLVHEIDSLIIRLLKQLKTKTKLFANNQFDILGYIRQRNIVLDSITVNYFQYSYQDYFNSLVKRSPFSDYETDLFLPPLRTIKLVDLKIVSQHASIDFEIDCTNFSEMNIYTFINLLKYRNVKAVILDTNRKWLDSNQPKYLIMITLFLIFFKFKTDIHELKVIYCYGQNTYNFVENFLSALKEIQIWPPMRIILNWPLQNYKVFNKTKFTGISFYGIKIRKRVLIQLYSCKLNSTISLLRCFLENDTKVWDLIGIMKNLNKIYIYEENYTWQCLFEFVAKRIKLSKLKEFSLCSKSTFAIFTPGGILNLKRFKFVMDSTNSKLIMVENSSGRELDLYQIKNGVTDGDKSEYDFYN